MAHFSRYLGAGGGRFNGQGQVFAQTRRIFRDAAPVAAAAASPARLLRLGWTKRHRKQETGPGLSMPLLFFEHLLIVLGVLAVAASVVLALHRSRSPQSSAAWILFIILVPYLAVPLFIALGFRKDRGRPLPRGTAKAQGPGPGPVFTALGCPAPTAGNRIAFHDTPETAAQALWQVLDNAEERVDVLLYVLHRDASGREFVRRLTALARRGVAVRVMLDWLGTLGRPRAELARLAAAGGQVHIFSPFPAVFSGGRLNLRNHRKLVMADGRLAWAGGRNVGDEYLAPGPGAWRDLSFTLEGPVLAECAALFRSDWAVTGHDPGAFPASHETAGEALLQLVPAGPDDPEDRLHNGLVADIHRADRRVWIATPYYVPSEPLSAALCTAARRGVDVRIVIPAKSNQWTADLARGAYLREAAAAGCRILRQRKGMLHAKAALIDDLGLTGSANFDLRSMMLNFEMMVACHDAATVADLEARFLALAPDCDEGLPATGSLRRLAEGVVRLGAPIL